MTTYYEKCAEFRKSLKDFQRSKQNPKDVFDLIWAGHKAMSMGDGIFWKDLLRIIEEERTTV